VNFLEDPKEQAADLHSHILVSKSAVLPGPALFLVKNGTAAKTPVKLGAEQGGCVEILTGLSGGEQVIVSGLDGLSEGLKVSVKR
jgi:multidrug efflux pump subunit AcrA (membrane-fusion protein)